MGVTNDQGQSPWATEVSQSEDPRPPSKRELRLAKIRRVSEQRPGIPEEGATARRFLDRILGRE
jgi:hypothetical protein